jgi:DNA-binding transcriptional MerR regulator
MRLRIDELATEAGTTSRNIRAYQARGLLPAPLLEGRTGYYGQEHLDRLQIIQELQDRGFSLAAIGELLKTWAQGGDLGHLLGFRHLLAAPMAIEEPTRVHVDELVERFPEAADEPGLLQRAIDLDLVRPLGDDVYEAPSPMLIEAGEELVRAGVPLSDILELVAALRGDMSRVADRFVGLVEEHIAPSVADAPRQSDFRRALESMRRLRPVAIEVVRPLIAQELEQARERALVRLAAELDEAAQDPEAS